MQEGTIKARMRQRLADWMLDVCELFEVAKEVFALSMMLLVSIPWVAIRGECLLGVGARAVQTTDPYIKTHPNHAGTQDRYLSAVKVDLAKFQLIGATTLLIISKLAGQSI